MFQVSKRAAFIRPVDVDKFIAANQRRRPFLPHRVAVLILSTRTDSVFLVQPRSALENGAPQVRVPPQYKLQGTVRDTAMDIMRDTITHRVHRNDLVYIGSTYGNKYQGAKVIPYGKMIHWMGVCIPRKRKVFNPRSVFYSLGYWCTQNQLCSMQGVSMSDRKYMMTMQAILQYASVTRQEVKLAHTAGRKLQTV